jgi:PhnB protein
MATKKKKKAPARKAKAKKSTKKKAKKKVNHIPNGFHSVTPYLTVKGGMQAIEFYKQAFNAKVVGKPFVDGNGQLGHVELVIGNSRFMLADEFPDFKNLSPQTLGGSPIGLCIYLKNADAVVEKAVSAGAKVVRPLENHFYGDRSGTVEDPFGHKWTIATHIEDVTPKEMQKRMQKMFENKE